MVLRRRLSSVVRNSETMTSCRVFASTSINDNTPTATSPASSSTATSSEFMGRPTCTWNPSSAAVDQLVQSPLTHAVPASISDYACIRAVRIFRWLSDRFFRERYLHRAFFLKGLSSCAPSAASAVLCLRNSLGLSPWDKKRSKHSTEGVQLASERRIKSQATTPLPSSPERVVWSSTTHTTTSRSTENNSIPPNDQRISPVSEPSLLRKLLAEAECHSAHFDMITHLGPKSLTRLERTALFLLQCAHMFLCSLLFLVSPRTGFRLLGYLLEESSVMMTHLINDIDMDKLPHGLQVPMEDAARLWGLSGSHFQLEVVVAPESATAPDQKQQEGVQQGSSERPTATVVGHESPQLKQETLADNKETSPPPLPQFTLREMALLMRNDDMFYRDQNHQLASMWDDERTGSQAIEFR